MLSRNMDEILVDTHDAANNSFRVTLTSADVVVNAVTDSIKIGDNSGEFATITEVSPTIKGLDVVVQDISITHANDSIKVGDGTDFLTINTDGSINTKEVRPANTDISTVTVTSASTLVKSANVSRKGLIIYNDTGARVFIKMGDLATTTSYTVDMPANSLYEAPYPCYTGIVTAIKGTGTATLRVTEITD